ncbi:periplasmic binding protein-like I [Globomyces pollinis-pini]|nr:periplasmic binding protein-like I [Globomyces pollinis-pini]
MNWWLLINLIPTLIWSLNPNGTHKIKIGVNLGEIPSYTVIQSIFLRAAQLNEQHPTLISNDSSIEIIWLDNKISSSQTIKNALQFSNTGVLSVIGSGMSRLSIINSLISNPYGIVQCCGSSTNAQLSSKTQYPTFFRTIPTDNSAAAAMVGYIAASGWSSIALIYSNEPYGQGIANTITILCRSQNITIQSVSPFDIGGNPAAARDIILNILDLDSKIIVYLGYPVEYGTLIEEAIKYGVFGNGYVWILSDASIGYKEDLPNTFQKLAGSLLFIPQEAIGPQALEFNDYYSQNRLKSNFTYRNETATSPTTFSYFFATCVDLMINGFDRLLKSNDSFTVDDLATGKLNHLLTVPDSFQFPNLETPSGIVKSDENGDRIGNFDILNIQPDGNSLIVSTWTDGKRIDLAPYYYPGGSSIQPKDRVIVEDIAIYAQLGGTLSILSIIFFVIVGLVWLITFVGTIKYRNSIVIRKSSGSIGLIMQLAMLLANFQFLIMIGKPTPAICLLDSVILPISFSAYYGVLLMKSFRLFRVLNFTTANKWSNNKVVCYGLLWSIPTIVIVIVWNAMDMPMPSTIKLSYNSYYWTCKSKEIQSPVIASLLIYNGFILLSNVLMAIQIRNIEISYNDSKMIGISIYNVTIIALFCCISLLSSTMGFDKLFLIKIISSFYVILFNILTTFSFKVFQAYNAKSLERKDTTESDKHGMSLKNTAKTEDVDVMVYFVSNIRDLFKRSDSYKICQLSQDSVQLSPVKNPFKRHSMAPIIWNIKELNHFECRIFETSMILVETNEIVTILKIDNADDLKSYKTFFQHWNGYIVHKTNAIETNMIVKNDKPADLQTKVI